MAMISTSDVANSLFLRRSTSAIKQAMNRAREELTTGRSVDPIGTLRGRTSALAALERSRSMLASYATAASETGAHAEAQQIALGRVMGVSGDIVGRILGLGPLPPEYATKPVAAAGRIAFQNAVTALNTQFGERSLFAGAASDRPAMAPANEIIAALVVETAGATTAEEVADLVDAWFDTPGGGFETMALLGSDVPAGPIGISPGETLTLSITATRPELRPALKGLAMTVLVSEGRPVGGRQIDRSALLELAGERLLAAQAGLVGLSSELGVVQGQIAAAEVRNAAEIFAVQSAVTDLIGVDPYEAATRLEDTRGRLESLFTITGRLQRLSLTEFLR